MNSICYIQHEDIDKEKWDSCIKEAGNSLIYGYSWWLDNISPGWHALVLNDYEAVMPLTWRKKYGIHYLYQPFCTAALGIFHKTSLTAPIEHFFNAIPSIFKYWDIDINEENNIPDAHINIYNRVNQILSLDRDYDTIKRKYSRLAKRTLIKANDNNLILIKNTDPEIIIDLYKKQYKDQHTNSLQEYDALKRCCEMAIDRHMARGYIAQLPGGEIVAFYIVLEDKNFVYSLLGGSTEKGKKMGGFYFLTDAAIRERSNSNKIFRFEGSDIEGIYFFNRQFGALSKTYLHIKQNRLPFLIKLFKK